MDPALSGAGNPFGAEGYKETAYETVAQLGRMPEAFFIPTAGGDTFYGIMKGFAEHLPDLDPDVHLMLVGPATAGVSDDPEGETVLAECREL